MMKGWSLPKRKKQKRFLKWKEWLEPWKSVDESLDAEFGVQKRDKYSPYPYLIKKPELRTKLIVDVHKRNHHMRRAHNRSTQRRANDQVGNDRWRLIDHPLEEISEI
jgi:hypothetical protein